MKCFESLENADEHRRKTNRFKAKPSFSNKALPFKTNDKRN